MEDDSVVFRVVVGDGVTVGEDVIIQGPASETDDPNGLTLEIPDASVIPDGAVVTDEAALREALSETPQRCRTPAAWSWRRSMGGHDH